MIFDSWLRMDSSWISYEYFSLSIDCMNTLQELNASFINVISITLIPMRKFKKSRKWFYVMGNNTKSKLNYGIISFLIRQFELCYREGPPGLNLFYYGVWQSPLRICGQHHELCRNSVQMHFMHNLAINSHFKDQFCFPCQRSTLQ